MTPKPALPDLTHVFETIDATWPAAARIEAGPWTLREGRGGGKRASAATVRAPWQSDDLGAAEKAMRLMGQAPLFMIRPEDAALDAALEAEGYRLIDPVDVYAVDIDALCDRKLPRVSAFAIWEPLEIMREIWEAGGVTPERQRVMTRVKAPKTGLFGRVSDSPAGAGFCALHDGLAMAHALEITPEHRGKGLGGWMMRCAGLWARDAGARHMAVLATQANTRAQALYTSLKMEVIGRYHYRILDQTESEAP